MNFLIFLYHTRISYCKALSLLSYGIHSRRLNRSVSLVSLNVSQVQFLATYWIWIWKVIARLHKDITAPTGVRQSSAGFWKQILKLLR